METPTFDPTPSAKLEVVRPRREWIGVRRFFRRLGFVAASLLIVPLAVAFLWLRFYGLPDQAKVWLLDEMARRGVNMEVNGLYLDPTGGILIDDVVVYRDSGKREVWIQVDRARLGMAWISWWQGRSLLESATVRNVELHLPLAEGETIDLREVHADVDFDGDSLNVRSAAARLLNVELFLRGRILLDGLPEPDPPTLEEQRARAELWRKVEAWAQDLETPEPIRVQVNFEFATSEAAKASVDLSAFASEFSYRGARFQEATLSAMLREEIVRLEEFQIGFARGELAAFGEAFLSKKQGEIQFESTANFTSLGLTMPGGVGDFLGRLTFRALPRATGRLRLDWTEGFTYDLQADLDWRAFRLGAHDFERFRLAFATNGKKLIVPELALKSSRGSVEAEFFRDEPASLMKMRLYSTVDPTVFKGVFGRGLDRFLESVHLPKNGPVLRVEGEALGLEMDDWVMKGRIDTGPFIYKEVGFLEAHGDFTFAGTLLTLPELKAKRKEGEVVGGIEFDFHNRWARLTDLKTNVHVHEVAPVLGGRFPSYVEPYRFNQPPSLVVNGFVDLDDTKTDLNTDLQVEIDAPGNMNWMFFGVDFVFGKPKAKLNFKNRDMRVDLARSGLLGGSFSGSIELDLRESDPPYHTKFRLKNVDFGKMMARCFNVEGTSGTMQGSADLKGRLNQLRTMKGKGGLKVRDGYLLSIPFLGGLSTFLSEIIPDWGHALASDADSEFSIDNGKVWSRKLDIYSTNFTLIGEGNYDYVDDNLNINVRVNVRGLPGLFLFPVSKLFEYKGRGPMKETKWEPVNF